MARHTAAAVKKAARRAARKSRTGRGYRVQRGIAAATVPVAIAAAVGTTLSTVAPASASVPASYEGWTVLSAGGTDDPDGADQVPRTANYLGIPESAITSVPQPGAFGIGNPKLVVIPLVAANSGTTFDTSTVQGTAQWVSAIRDAGDGPLAVVALSQGARSLGDAIYVLDRDDDLPAGPLLVVLMADTRFPNTGAETVFPSILPGVATNGPRQPIAADGLTGVSICIQSDPVCGFNPYTFSSWFYLVPGFLETHSQHYGDVADNQQVATWQDNGWTYIVYAPDANPWGQLLRDAGIPVPTAVDDVLTTLVPYVTPGTRTTIAGWEVPLPREIQVAVYDALGWDVPVTAPDQVDAYQARHAVDGPTAEPNAAPVTVPQLAEKLGATPSVDQELPTAAAPQPTQVPAVPPTNATPTAATPADPAPVVAEPAAPAADPTQGVTPEPVAAEPQPSATTPAVTNPPELPAPAAPTLIPVVGSDPVDTPAP